MSGYVRAYEGNEPYIFVSYAHADSEKVLPVIRTLYDQKYRAWYDEGIAPGSEWPQNIVAHMQKSSAFIAFVSKNYFNSSNCLNELQLACEQKKVLIPISLDSISKHSLLDNTETIDFSDDIVNKLEIRGILGVEFIGDGITGYQYSIEKKRSLNSWNLMLGLAALLIIVFSATLYGLYNGWFDNLLPAKQIAIETIAPTPQPQDTISIGENIIGSLLPVKFSSNEEKDAVYQKLGWNQPYEMTYKDLVGMDGVTHLEISNEPITDIAFAAYLPNLEVITLSGSQITDLSPIIDCPKLKTVQVTADMLPTMIFPTPRNFEVVVT